MKKIYSLLAIAAGMVALASCAKEAFVAPAENNTIIPEGMKEVVFSTILSKTTIAEGQPVWAEKDSVKILWVEDNGEAGLAVCETKAEVNPVDGTIKAVVGEARDYYYAVYPQWATSTLEASADNPDYLQVTVRSTSADGSWAAAHYAAALTTAGELTFNFKSVSNALKFTVTTPGVTKVQIATPDEAMTAAKVKFAFDGEEIGESVEVVTPQKTSTVTVNGPGTYYAPIICDAQWTSGFVISEYAGDQLLSFSEAPNPLYWGRSQIYAIGTAEDHKTTTHDWFFKADGTGSGESWDDAAGIEKFIELLSGPTGHLYINDHNLYLAAGTYNLARDGKPSVDIVFPMPVSTNILGGYPADATGTDLTGRDVAENKTIIYSNANITNNRIFLFKGKTGAFTIDGIQFGPYDGIEKSVRGYVMYAQGDADFSADNSLITFSNCTFTGIKGEYYGAIDLNNANGKMKIENCTFEGNDAQNIEIKTYRGGAALFIENATDCTVDNCTFKNNKTSNTAFGGTVVLNDGNLLITNSTFENNESATYGGAFGMSAQKGDVAPVATIRNCQFISNKAKNGGAINQFKGNLTCEECTFTSNEATRESKNFGGGAISTFYSTTKAEEGDPVQGECTGSTTLKNCTFVGNHAYGRGGCIHQLNSGGFVIDGCRFKENYAGDQTNGGGAIYHAGKSNTCDLYISNSRFEGNYMLRNSTNASGSSICTKSGSNIYIHNSSFTGEQTKTNGEGVISISEGCTGLYLFRCSFLNNTTNKCIIRAADKKAFIANCTFAETVKDYTYGIIYNTGNKTTTALNNLVIASAADKFSFGNASNINSGYNIYSALNGVTLVPAEGAADVTGKLAADVFAGATPAFDENYWIETKDLSGIMTAPAAATIKAAIQGASEDFYTWLESIKAFDTMPAETWQCGAYQK